MEGGRDAEDDAVGQTDGNSEGGLRDHSIAYGSVGMKAPGARRESAPSRPWPDDLAYFLK